jgi:hypothetical protein
VRISVSNNYRPDNYRPDNYRDNARKQPPSAAIRRKAKQKIYEHQSAAHE